MASSLARRLSERAVDSSSSSSSLVSWESGQAIQSRGSLSFVASRLPHFVLSCWDDPSLPIPERRCRGAGLRRGESRCRLSHPLRVCFSSAAGWGTVRGPGGSAVRGENGCRRASKAWRDHSANRECTWHWRAGRGAQRAARCSVGGLLWPGSSNSSLPACQYERQGQGRQGPRQGRCEAAPQDRPGQRGRGPKRGAGGCAAPETRGPGSPASLQGVVQAERSTRGRVAKARVQRAAEPSDAARQPGLDRVGVLVEELEGCA